MDIRFTPNMLMTVEGKRADIFKKYGKEWTIKEHGLGNGNWLLTKKADIFVNGISYRNFVLDYYGKMRLTENLFNRFRDDLLNGVVTLP